MNGILANMNNVKIEYDMNKVRDPLVSFLEPMSMLHSISFA